MEHARKMILVPEDRYKDDTVGFLVPPKVDKPVLPTVQTPGDPKTRLDSQMYHILNSKSGTSDYERWNKLKETLRRYLFHKSKDDDEDGSDDDEDDDDTSKNETSKHLVSDLDLSSNSKKVVGEIAENLIVDSLPKLYKNRGSALLNFIKATDNDKRITWSKQGEVIIDGKKIIGSNIIDLVNDALRRRKSFNPQGRSDFARYLQSINVPRDYVGNKEYWRPSTATIFPEVSKAILPSSTPIEKKKKGVRRNLYKLRGAVGASGDSYEWANTSGFKRYSSQTPKQVKAKWKKMDI